jgi:hypothetical protein
MEVPKRLKVDLPYDPVTPLLGTCLKKPKSAHSREISTAMFFAALVTTCKMWNQSRCRSMTETVWQIHSGALLAIRKSDINGM